MLVNLLPDTEGTFSGDVWEPTSNRMLRGRMQVDGNVMRFENCNGDTCRKVVWQRLR